MKFDLPSKKLLAVVLTAVVVLAAVPAALMIGCNMPMIGNDCVGHTLAIGQVLSQACSGIVLTTHAIEGVAASGLSLLLLVIAAAVAAVVVLRAAQSRERAYVFVPIAPPPPPEDPLGERLTL